MKKKLVRLHTVILITLTLLAFMSSTALAADPPSWTSPLGSSVSSFQASGFTGSGTYSIPLEFPKAAGGAAPQLALVYNSLEVDQGNDPTESGQIRLGKGWSLAGIPSIQRKGLDGDEFYLILNGMCSKLNKGADGFYHTEQESYIRISYNTGDVGTIDDDWWLVETREGSSIALGKYNDSRHYTKKNNADYYGCTAVNYRWDTDAVQDKYGNTMIYYYYEYVTDNAPCYSIYDWTTEVCSGLARIKYNYREEADGNAYAVEMRDFYVDFLQDGGVGWNYCVYTNPYNPSQQVYTVKDLNNEVKYTQIIAKITNLNNDEEQIIGHYDLGYKDASGENMVLETVAYTPGAGTESLPAIRFTYDASGHLTEVNDPATGSKKQIAYESYSINDKTYYRVSSETAHDGLGNSYSQSYTYSGALWDSTADEFRGHNYVKQSDAVGNYTETWYHQDAEKKGLSYETQTKDSSGNLYNKSTSTYEKIVTDTYKNVSVGSDGAAFALDYDGNVKKWTGSIWDAGMGGQLKQISTRSASEVWGIGMDDKVWKWNGSTWTKISDVSMKQVSVGSDGAIFGMDMSGYVKKWTGTAWGASTGRVMKQFSVRSATILWGVGSDDKVYTCNGSTWTLKSSTLMKKVAIGSDGAVLATDMNNYIQMWTGSAWYAIGGQLYDVSVRTVDEFWGTAGASNAGEIWRYTTTTGWRQMTFSTSFIALIQADQYIYDGDATFEHTQTKVAYDSYANAIKTSYLGDVDVSGDELYAYTDYMNKTTLEWLLGVPYHKYIKSSDDSTVLAESWSYYSDTYDGSITYNDKMRYLRKLEKAAVIGSRGNAANPTEEKTYDQWDNIISITDAMGNVTSTTTYDSTYHSYPISVTDAEGNTAYTYYYGVNEEGDTGFVGNGLWGLPKSFQDINGHFERTTYDVFGRPVASWNEDFSEEYPQTSMEYTYYQDAAHPAKVVNRQRKAPGSSETFDTYTYVDGLGRTVQTQTPSDEAGKMMVNGMVDYNSVGQVWKQYVGYKAASTGAYIANPVREKPSTATYDAVGRVIRTDNPDGTFTRTIYDDYVTTTVDANNKQIRTTSDANGRVIKTELFTGSYPTATLYSTTTHEYDALGQAIKTTDAQGNQNTVTYDVLGRKIAMHDMDMGDWSSQYDKLGRLTSQTDAKGQTITMEYDVRGRLIRKSNPDGSYTQYDYDTFSGYTGTNSQGKLVREFTVAAGGETVTNVCYYDAYGRPIKTEKTIDGNTYVTQTGYDALNRVAEATYPDDSKIYYSFNNNNGAVQKIGSIAGGDQYLKGMTYNQYGLLTSKVLGNDVIQNYTYDPNNLRVSGIGSSGWNCAAGETFKEVSVGSDGTLFGTDMNGNVLKWTGSNWTGIGGILKQIIVLNATEVWGIGGDDALWKWDGSNWNPCGGFVKQISVASDGVVWAIGGDDALWKWDGSNWNPCGGVVKQVSAGNAGVAWAIGGDDALWKWDGSTWSPCGGFVRQLSAGSNGVVWVIGGDNTLWKWDGSNWNQESDKQMQKISVGREGTLLGIDINGTGWKWNGSTWTLIGGVLKDISVLNANEVWGIGSDDRAWKWNELNDISYTYNDYGMVTGIVDAKNSTNWTYTYDDIYRLVNAKRGSGTTLGNSDIYDKSYSYNNIGNITSFEGNTYAYDDPAHKHAVTSVANIEYFSLTEYTYDANGNMTSGGVRSYTWNADNKPVSITKAGVTTNFTYGPSGERVKKQTGSNWKVYVNGIYEKDQSGAQTCYIDAAGVTVKKKADGSLFFILTDYLGGTSTITDAAGNVVTQQFYQPYGQDDAVGSFENEVDDHKFTGQEEDTETGLYYYGARYYDPGLGRFISPDPAHGPNRYAYCSNNPVNIVDPTGYSGEFIDDLYVYTALDGTIFESYYDYSVSNIESAMRAFMLGMSYDGFISYDAAQSYVNGNMASEDIMGYLAMFVNDLPYEQVSWRSDEIYDYSCEVDPTWAQYDGNKDTIVNSLFFVGAFVAMAPEITCMFLINLEATWLFKYTTELVANNYDSDIASRKALDAMLMTAGITGATQASGEFGRSSRFRGMQDAMSFIFVQATGFGGRTARGYYTSTDENPDVVAYAKSQSTNAAAKVIFSAILTKKFGVSPMQASLLYDTIPSNINYIWENLFSLGLYDMYIIQPVTNEIKLELNENYTTTMKRWGVGERPYQELTTEDYRYHLGF